MPAISFTILRTVDGVAFERASAIAASTVAKVISLSAAFSTDDSSFLAVALRRDEVRFAVCFSSATGASLVTSSLAEHPDEPKRGEMVELLTQVANEIAFDVAKDIIHSIGGVEEMADIPADKILDVIDECEAELK